jgi:hypothetical protein
VAAGRGHDCGRVPGDGDRAQSGGCAAGGRGEGEPAAAAPRIRCSREAGGDSEPQRQHSHGVPSKRAAGSTAAHAVCTELNCAVKTSAVGEAASVARRGDL